MSKMENPPESNHPSVTKRNYKGHIHIHITGKQVHTSTFPMQKLILATIWDIMRQLQHISVPQLDGQDILIPPIQS